MVRSIWNGSPLALQNPYMYRTLPREAETPHLPLRSEI